MNRPMTRLLRGCIVVVAALTLTAGDCDGPNEPDDDGNVAALPDGPGKDLFTGGALCYTCHGEDATGTVLGPDLRDDVWLHGDGSVASIRQIIVEGVENPVEYPGAMPPEGGANLTNEQIELLAQFVHDISH